MPFCTECGNKLGAGAKFCPECGTKVAPASAPAPKKTSSVTPPRKPKSTVNRAGDGSVLPSYRGAATTKVHKEKKISKAGWTPPVKTDSKSVKGGTELTAHEQWCFYSNKLVCKSKGYGIQALKNALPVGGCGFVHFRISAENVGNTGKGIITNANIILQWKGPSAPTMGKVRNNGALQSALTKLQPNKGFIEVLGTKNLSTENVFDRWRPGSGSKVIQD
uniref:Zinc-ribbon domain-containing protein n=1 Tax=Lotharella globosa TaxID=91324 RepID=A0A7S3YFP9_9EUKA